MKSAEERWEVDFSVSLASLNLKNPLLAASGTFGYGDETKDLVNPDQFGGICTKSLTLKSRDGNPPPRIAELEYGMLNSIGLANIGVQNFIDEKLPYLKVVNTTVIVNVAGFSVSDYVETVKKLDSSEGIDGYEINVSCPNVHGGLEFGSSAESAAELTGKLRKETDRLLMIKLSPNVTSIEEIAIAVESAGADAISLINTLVGLSLDVISERPLLERGYGGYSGPGIKPVALAMVNKVFNSVKIPVVGMGGITNSEDVVQFMLAGAAAVQIGTQNYIDPTSVISILDGLTDLCEAKGLRNISKLTGRLKKWE